MRKIAWLFAFGALGMVLGCRAPDRVVYATPDYPTWQRTTEVPLDYPIPGHQDRFRIPRMNSLGFGARPTLEGGKLRWSFPEGTVIVKEVYDTLAPAAGDEPTELTIMVKAPRDKRSRGGWLWITRDLPKGEEKVFAGNFCITCHSNANERHPYGDKNPREEFRDYVFYVPVPPGPSGSPSPTPTPTGGGTY